MNARRLEVQLPADMSARDSAAVAHAIGAVLDEAGVDAEVELRTEEPDEDGR
ncbi:hypothetical protein ACIQMJ_35615 [Actinosynnema sp. NPDC091369]